MNTIFQPPRQHTIVTGPSQVQCFCHSPSACPSFDQSVQSAVTLETSNIFTPSWIFLTMFNFASTNSLASDSVQRNFCLGDNKCLKAAMSAHFEKLKLTCSTRPKNALASVIFFGSGKFLMLSVIESAGAIESLVTLKPTYSTSSSANLNFFLLKFIPPFEQVEMYLQVKSNEL